MSDPVLLPNCVVPIKYTLTLDPDFESFGFDGEVNIDVSVRSATSVVQIHTREIVVKRAIFSRHGSIECTSISYDEDLMICSIFFAQDLELGNGVLSLSYTGTVNNQMAGFYRCSYSDADGNKRIMASTQFEALDARRALPCWDEPATKASFSVTIILRNPLHSAISNMPISSCKYLANGKRQVTFADTPVMSTYLLAFAIGEFDVISDVSVNPPISLYTPPGRLEEGRFSLYVARKCLTFFNEYFEVFYPLPKLDLIAITEFAMGAMENWGLITFREAALMVNNDTASIAQKQQVALTVAHEISHQWFGNLVTMKWWDDLWLNEGFATWMEYYCIDAVFPEWNIWDQFVTDCILSAYRLDGLRSTHPVQVPIHHAREVEQVFDAISYSKGSCVVRMLASSLSSANEVDKEDLFRKGLRAYMNSHKYSNTQTNDLWRALTDATNGHVDVNALAGSWTMQTGYPWIQVIHEEYHDDCLELVLRQSRFLVDGGTDDAVGKIWEIPMFIGVYSGSSQVSVHRFIINNEQATIRVPLTSSSDWIKMNFDMKSLIRVSHSKEMISRMEWSRLSDVDKAGILLDSIALSKAGYTNVDTTVQLLKRLSCNMSGISVTVWEAIATVLGGLNYALASQVDVDANAQEMLASFHQFVKCQLLLPALSQIGIVARSEHEADTARLVRSRVLDLCESYAWDETSLIVPTCRSLYAEFMAGNEKALPSDIRVSTYRIVLKNSACAKEYDELLARYRSSSNNIDQRQVMNSLGCVNQMDLKRNVLEWNLKSGEVKLQDIFSCIRCVAPSSTAGGKLAWQHFTENFEGFCDALKTAAPSLMDAVIVSSATGLNSRNEIDQVRAFFENHPMPNNQRKVLQTIEGMTSTVLFGERMCKEAAGGDWF